VEILFLALFFIGELIGLLGLGVLIYLGVYQRQRGRNSED
jgi:ABC-type proline/glycine betaine transport system permease subunit